MNRRNFPCTVERGPVVRDIPIQRIRSDRTADRSSVEYLKRSVDQIGVIKPIIVKRVGGHYKLIDGVIRTYAARELGHTTIPAKVI